jgi:hypothetical protein
MLIARFGVSALRMPDGGAHISVKPPFWSLQ